MSGVVRGPSALAIWWATRRTIWAMSLVHWAWTSLAAPPARREIALKIIDHLRTALKDGPSPRLGWWDRLRGSRRLVVIDHDGRVQHQRIVSGDVTLLIPGIDANAAASLFLEERH